MDVHIAAAITEDLNRRNINVLTSQEDQTRRSDDEALLVRAKDLGRLLFSQDQDLLRIARQWQNDGQSFPGYIFMHQQGTSIGQCIEDLELLAQCCTENEVAKQIIFWPLP